MVFLARCLPLVVKGGNIPTRVEGPARLVRWRLFDSWFLLLCLPADTEHGQRLPEVDVAQQLKLRDRQRFFEEVFQHDVDVYLSSAHLCIRDYKRRELGGRSFRGSQINLNICFRLLQLRSAASRPWR